MTILLITAVLFIITGILHNATLLRFGNNAATRPVAAFGVVYLALGILLWLGTFSWLPIVALILTIIGGVGATTQINANPEMRSWTLLFIGIDVAVVVLLAIHMLTG
jgi:hypothetical protein